MKEKITQAVAAVVTFGSMLWSPLGDWVNAAGGQAEIVAAIVAVYTVVHGVIHYAHGKAAALVLLALLIPVGAHAQEATVPATDLEPAQAVEPLTPLAPASAVSLSTSVQQVLDAVSTHDSGGADIASAEAAERTAQASYEAARQRTADAMTTQAERAAAIVARARALIAVLEALVVEYEVAQ